MHAGSGMRAIELAGLLEPFKAVARYEDQGMRLLDKQGTLLRAINCAEGGDRPEIDRRQLRDLFLNKVPDASIHWGHRVETVNPEGDAWNIVFTNGTTRSFDLVVGADGTWSRVRPLVSPAQPVYSGVTFWELTIDDIDKRQPGIAALVGHGKIFALGDRRGLIAQRNAGGELRIYAAAWIDEGGLGMAKATKANILHLFEGWAPRLLELVTRANDAPIATWPLYALPIGHRWERRDGLTLLGDAAHLMSPFSGAGANLALVDGADLALAIAGAGAGWRDAVRRHEERMFTRAAEAAAGAAQGILDAFAEDAIAKVSAFFGTIEASRD